VDFAGPARRRLSLSGYRHLISRPARTQRHVAGGVVNPPRRGELQSLAAFYSTKCRSNGFLGSLSFGLFGALKVAQNGATGKSVDL